jgi:hypothetical protein
MARELFVLEVDVPTVETNDQLLDTVLKWKGPELFAAAQNGILDAESARLIGVMPFRPEGI